MNCGQAMERKRFRRLTFRSLTLTPITPTSQPTPGRVRCKP
jgi:hypothetical protein